MVALMLLTLEMAELSQRKHFFATLIIFPGDPNRLTSLQPL
jgi:hypothetical protein